MNKQFDNHFDSLDLSRKWNTLMLSNFERWITLSFDRGQESIAFANQQLKTACSELGEVNDPSKWSEITQIGVRNMIESSRDMMCAATDFQIEAQQLLRQQATETHKLVKALLNHNLPHQQSVDVGARQGNKTTTTRQTLAA